MTIEQTLAERKARYGKFVDVANLAQELKETMRCSLNWPDLQNTQKESLDMIVHKIARILCGDPDYFDSWHDIVGYAKLEADKLNNVKVRLDDGSYKPVPLKS